MKKKIFILIILLILMVIPVFATNFNDTLLTKGSVLIPGTKLEDFEEMTRIFDYCYRDENEKLHCGNKYIDYNRIITRDDYNQYGEKIPKEKDEKKFIGWKVANIRITSDTYDSYNLYELEPYYGKEHKIIKQPTFKDSTVEVTEENEVEKYRWYEISNQNVLSAQNKIRKGELFENNPSIFKYDESTNTYSTSLHTHNRIRLVGYIDTEKESKITVKYPINKSGYHIGIYEAESCSMYRAKYCEKSYESQINVSETNCDNNKGECTKEYDLSNIKNGTYLFEFTSHEDVLDENTEASISFENIKTHINRFNYLSDETTKTLSYKNKKEDKEYFVLIKYEDGTNLISDSFKYNKDENIEPIKEINEKISDIVANPLTGDNIIYTVVVALISLTMIVLLSKKLKNS